jgi:hypothetical protein
MKEYKGLSPQFVGSYKDSEAAIAPDPVMTESETEFDESVEGKEEVDKFDSLGEILLPKKAPPVPRASKAVKTEQVSDNADEEQKADEANDAETTTEDPENV